MSRNAIVRISIYILFVCTVLPVRAQVDVATINGTITDSSGAIIPNVDVTATNIETGRLFPGRSNEVGNYQITNLPLGHYALRFERASFRTFERNGIEVQIGQAIAINVTLQVGSSAQTVTVTDAVPLVDTERSTIATTLTGAAMTDLPLDATGGRDVTTFAYSIVPTTSGTNYSGHIAGSQDATKNVIVDGTDASGGLQGFVQVIGMEAVQQFEVQTSGISAEAGGTGGGVLIMELKSGTNQFHGSVYGILANKALNANAWDSNYFRAQCVPGDIGCHAAYGRGTDSFTVGGVSAGGPIWRNHTFAFGDFERYNQQQLAYAQDASTVPTTSFLNGDFSALLGAPIQGASGQPIINPCTGTQYLQGQIFDPSTATTVGGTACYSPFPGNIIQPGRISAVAQKVVATYKSNYAPANSELQNNYPAFAGVPSTINEHLDVKVDHNLSSRQHINSSFNWWSLPILNSGNPWQTGTNNGGPFNSGDFQRQENRSIRVQHTYTFTPNLLNFASLAYNENAASDQPDHAVDPTMYGFTQTQNVMNFPVINFNGSPEGITETPIGMPYADGYVFDATIFSDAVSWSHNKHNFKFGGAFKANQINSRTEGGVQTYNFSNTTNSPTDPSVQPYVGFAFANFLLGDVQSASNNVEFLLHGRRKVFNFFAQDDWKVKSNFTVNLGLRWDVNKPFHELNGHWTNFDVNAQNPLWSPIRGAYEFGTKGNSTFETQQNYHQFGPHAGFSYSPTQKLVIRAAYGVFYVPLGVNQYTGVPFGGVGAAVGFIGTNNVLNPSQNEPGFNWDSGYPGTPTYAPRVSTLTDVSGGAVYVAPNTLTMGITQNWNIGLQYGFTPKAVFSLNYLANAGHKLHDSSLVPYNYPTLQTYLPLLNSGHINDVVNNTSTASAAGVPYPYPGFSGYAFQAINPFPQLASAGQQLLFVGPPDGVSAYRAFVAEMETRTMGGLTADVSYTFSRAEGNVADSSAYQEGPGTAYTQNPYDPSLRAHDVLDYNMTHQVKGYIDYDLPFGRNGRWLSSSKALDYAIGGWTIGAELHYNSGTPFSAIASTNDYPGWRAVFANRNPDISLHNPFRTLDLNNPNDTSNTFFNPNAFSNPAFGQFGNQPTLYTALTNWAYYSEDLSLIKHFNIGRGDRIHASIRSQFFDVLNRHHWGAPDTVINSPTFGQVLSVTGFRTGQLGARVEW
jgi:Carboxypeptidase regulatory-like domain/TonB dependent receptor